MTNFVKCEECCANEANTGNHLEIHEDLLHKDGYNETKNLELESCRQCLECEDCDDISTCKRDLEVHDDNSYEEVSRIDWLNNLN